MVRKFNINELSSSAGENGATGSVPLRSAAVLTSSSASGSGGGPTSSVATSSSPINPNNHHHHGHQHSHHHHSSHYAPNSVTTINMTQSPLDCTPSSSSAAARLSHLFYQNGNDQQSSLSMHGNDGNINWRDEADGSEEDELRLNLMAASPMMDLPLPPPPSPPLESPPHGNFLLDGPSSTSFADVDEPTGRFGTATSSNLNARPTANPPWSQQAKEKRLRETEFYLSQMENVIESFRKLLRSNEWSQHNQNLEERDNAKRAAETLPKMINISNLRASEENSVNNNYSRNNKNRMQTQYNNNHQFYSLPHSNNHELSDNISAGDPFDSSPDRLAHLNFINQIGLESLDTDHRSYRYEENSDVFAYFKLLNQQVYRLLMHNNQQINQHQQLIWSWISCQQKWLENQALSGNDVRVRSHPTGHFADSTDLHAVNSSPHHHHHHQSAMLNNQTVPGMRANNFWDNFKSQSCQNNIQANRMSRVQPSQNSTNCNNSCLNMGPCNKNIRSQSLSSCYTRNKSPQVHTQHNNLNSVNLNQNNNLSELDKNSNKMQQYKKMVSDFEKLLGDCRLSTTTATTSSEPRFFDIPSTSNGVPSQSTFKFTMPELGCKSEANQNGLKRKKLSNMDLNAVEQHEDGCECDGNDNYFGIQPSHDRVRVKANLASRPSIFTAQHSTTLPKKPLPSNLVKFSATDSAKLMQQHGVGQEETESTSSSSSREHVRPLMPAEGRSSEQRFLANNSISVQLKLPKATPKFAIRPPIAGNETNTTPSNTVIYGPELKNVQNGEVQKPPLKEKSENLLNGNHNSEPEESPNLLQSADSVHLETNTESGGDIQVDPPATASINGPKSSEASRQDSSRTLLNGTRSGSEDNEESDEAIHSPLSATTTAEVRLSGDGEQGL